MIDFAAFFAWIGEKEAAVRLAEDFGVSYEKSGNAPPDRKRHNRSQPDKNQRSRDFRKRNGIVSRCYAIICACWSIGKQHAHSRRMPSASLFVEALQRINYTEYLLDILLYGEIEEKAALIAAQGKEVLRQNSEFQSLPPETQEAVKGRWTQWNRRRHRQKSRETLEGRRRRREEQHRNCLTVFQRDPLFRGAAHLNL